jgi:hypothetical protein
MNIKISEIALAVSKGLKIEEYICLKVLEDGCSYLFPNNYFHVNMEYCDTKGNLTLKSKQLLAEIGGDKIVSSKVDNKYEILHKKLQNELIALTDKKQKLLQGKYQFLPNEKDLSTRLAKIIKKYKLDDWERVEKLLIDYVYKCHKANFEYTQTIEYYIEKLNSSKLATDYFNDDVKEEVKQIEVKDTKNLF